MCQCEEDAFKSPIIQCCTLLSIFAFTKYLGDIIKTFVSNCQEKCLFLAGSVFSSGCERQTPVLKDAGQVVAFPIHTSARDSAIPEAKQCCGKLVTRAAGYLRHMLYGSL